MEPAPEDRFMPTYITMFSYTDQGIKNIKESPARVEAAREGLAAIGVEIKEIFLTIGRYDLVAIIEAPDDATATKALLITASQGNVRSESMRAFTESEFQDIIGDLP